MKNDQFIKGKKIFLRTLNKIDIRGAYRKWLNDSVVCRFNMHARYPIGEQELLSYVESTKNNSSSVVFAICDEDTKKHIGNISLQKIDYIDRSAEIAIIIGEKNFWGKGIGFEAWGLVMAYGFDVLNLHRIYCGMVSENIGMIRIAEKSKMKKEGVRRKAFYKDGVYHDIVDYGILKHEYEKGTRKII